MQRAPTTRIVCPVHRSQRCARTCADHRWATARRTARALGALALSGAAGGCGGGDGATGPAGATLLGSHALVALDDRPVPPVTVTGPTQSSYVVEGTLTLRGDRTFVNTTVTRTYRADGSAVPGSDVADTRRGRFTARGAALTFSEDFGRPLGWQVIGTAMVTGTRLVYTADVYPGAYTYVKG